MFKYDNDTYGIHETYYENGNVNGWSTIPVITASSIDGLAKVLDDIKRDIGRSMELGILDYHE